MKRKGFTLVELLVVIAIIALLMSILMPALSRVRQMSQRVVCGSNLAGIGKTIITYSNDYKEAFPVAGGRKAQWSISGTIKDWDALIANPPSLPTVSAVAYGGTLRAKVTVTSSLYLLVKYSGASPKQFVCKGDQGTHVFNNLGIVTDLEDITEAWDFGSRFEGGIYEGGIPGTHVSYSYQMPYYLFSAVDMGGHAIHSSSSPQSPLMADRNPYCDEKSYDSSTYAVIDDVRPPTWDSVSQLYIDEDGLQNSHAHQREGQEVLYQDGHVKFEEHPNVGIDKDNIWYYWNNSDNSADPGDPKAVRAEKTKARETGLIYSSRPVHSGGEDGTTNGGAALPWGEKDAFLVTEYQQLGAQDQTSGGR
ncbi:MAG: type II secretion system protein [Planctomycetota bacterium]|jgi:prepilin-type N-terminal cleavage/methylation domain-containing protein